MNLKNYLQSLYYGGVIKKIRLILISVIILVSFGFVEGSSGNTVFVDDNYNEMIQDWGVDCFSNILDAVNIVDL